MSDLATTAGAADDPLITILDDPPPPLSQDRAGWTVAIIDDDMAVHDGTRFALSEYRLDGRGLTFLSAMSAAEGRELLRRHPDVAVILLDVVMESDEAGLDLIHFVRRSLANETARIILRTGQPGHAPEQRIVVDYDINDYKSKTELTAEKLFTTITAALRSHEQIRRLTRMRQGLELIADAASVLHRARTVAELGELALKQAAQLVDGTGSGLLLSDIEATGDLSAIARSGRYVTVASPADLAANAPAVHRAVEKALLERTACIIPGAYVGLIPTGSHQVVLVVDVAGEGELEQADRTLFDVFCARLAAAIENVALYEALEEANAALEDRVAERSAQLMAANQRLEAQADELRRVNALKNELLGIVAHDLKNPLSVILGRAEMLADELNRTAPDLASAQRQVAAIRESADRLSGIVSDRIADAQRDAPAVALRVEVFDLAEVVRRVVDANTAQAARKGQSLSLAIGGPAAVHADADRVAEALDNLLSNALKYSPVGGSVAVTLAVEGGEAVVRVTDSGPGICASDRARLFRPFQRLSATPTGGEGSTGLGLYSAKRIVDLHGGRIGLDPVEAGSCFFMALPIWTDRTQ